jgi:hypothetical protein
MDLHIVVLAVWALMHGGAERLAAAPAIASAIEYAVNHDSSPPFTGDRNLDAAVMGYYALRESWLQVNAVGDNGASCGPWQIRCEYSRKMSLRDQASLWLRMVHQSSLGDVDSSPRRAADRLARARRLLERIASESRTRK